LGKSNISFIGGGAWGVSLALAYTEKFSTILYKRNLLNKDVIQNQFLNCTKTDKTNLPKITDDLSYAIRSSEIIFITVPSLYCVEVIKKIILTGEKNKKIIITCKGFSNSGKILYSQLVKEDSSNQYFVFSGPTFSTELSKKLPSAIVLASNIKKNDLENLSINLSLSYLRVYSSSDPIGVSLGGILKNIIAIAAGISDGLGFGLNARSALITRGLNEMFEISPHFGIKKNTIYGLSFLGDLLLTSSSNLSRNYKLGFNLAKSEEPKSFLDKFNLTAEGIRSAKLVYDLAEKNNLDLPIISSVYRVIYENYAPREITKLIFSREHKFES
jgi:glycerol-3-phosphate dehydrogenase (NAD(P)+)